MVTIILPKTEVGSLTQNYGRFLIGPLENGFGITIGNALRRVLLSSLPGAAVTSVKVDGVHHEFTPIEGVKEDTIEFILNVKQLRLRMDGDEPVRLSFDRTGEGPILAGDIETPAGIEVVNPELRLLTVDSDSTRVSIELTVQKGKGYSSAEQREKLPIGELPVDAIFSPIRKVNYAVKSQVIAPLTNLERIELEVWTDGTIRPLEAVTQASRILAKHFIIMSRLREEDLVPLEAEAAATIEGDRRDMPIEDLNLSVRAYNCLKRAGITKVGEVLDRLMKGEEEIMSIRNFGRKSLIELQEKLREHGFLDEMMVNPEGVAEETDEDEEE
ncbi:MAG: DNA-directed RNA polymerase subunit alpha [Chloroflexi bacterium]|nr:DNA-directed RNA polymerase subunit alpha [Chloroflexota bacterium]